MSKTTPIRPTIERVTLSLAIPAGTLSECEDEVRTIRGGIAALRAVVALMAEYVHFATPSDVLRPGHPVDWDGLVHLTDSLDAALGGHIFGAIDQSLEDAKNAEGAR
jgi:hypothetical protein